MTGNRDGDAGAGEEEGREPVPVVPRDDLSQAGKNGGQGGGGPRAAARGQGRAIRQLLEVYEQHGCTVIAVKRVEPEQVGAYGVIEANHSSGGLHDVADVIEKPRAGRAPSNLAVVGRYVLTPEIFPRLQRTAPGAREEIQLSDALRTMAREDRVLAVEIVGERYDAGTRIGLMQATIDMALSRPDLGPVLRAWLERKVDHLRTIRDREDSRG
ncbi:MAG: hypothetical protein JSV80_02730 [Acidobacteriota bacterium]|nr:MAG: hypothetical protein JSV80_02730 [Acidobacteriota bacterium]